jgi:hypothetical protein
MVVIPIGGERPFRMGANLPIYVEVLEQSVIEST